MVIRVAIISPPGHEVSMIQTQLKNPMKWLVKDIPNIDILASEFATRPYQAMIIRFASFGFAQVEKLKRIQQRFPTVTLVATSPDVDAMSRFEVAEWSKKQKIAVRVLSEPTELQDVASVLEKIVKGSEGAFQRMHSRKKRADDAELVDNGGLRLKARFLDFSQMGAKLQIFSNSILMPKLLKNQRVSLVYPSSSNPKKTHHIEAIIVWEGTASNVVESLMFGPMQTVGLKFLAFS